MRTYAMLRQSGVFQALRRFNRHRLVVMASHGVLPPTDKLIWHPLREQVDIDTFSLQIDEISRFHTWVDLDTSLRFLRGEVTIRNPVLMTFDDGYRNNIDVALPILESRGIKPVLFLTTGYLGNSRTFWFDRFDYVIQQLRSTRAISLEERTFQFDPSNRLELRAQYAALRSYAKGLDWSDERFHDFFDRVCTELESFTGKSLGSIQPSDPVSATLDKALLQVALDRGAIDIGSHTVDHMRIDKQDPVSRASQLVQSKIAIEFISGSQCRAFCYPNGNWDKCSRDAVGDAGYEIAFTTDGGLNRPHSDLLTLRRQFLPLTFQPEQLQALTCGALDIKDWLHAPFRRNPA